MIKNELRLGNIIGTHHGIVTVVELSEDIKPYGIRTTPNLIHATSDHGQHGEPLTEEWLFKFGFKKNQFWFEHTNLQHPISKQGEFFHMYKGHNCIDIKIEYVHQLQNLCYALTGEELTIK